MTAMAGSVLTLPAIRDRLRRAGDDIGVRREGLRVRGDHDRDAVPRAPALLIPAAVLVPLVDRPAGPTVMLTRRTDHLAAHAGQISFPGGRTETVDLDAVGTALRERQGGIGLARDRIEIAGRLGTYRTGTGFEVTPLVGLVSPPFELAIDPNEVAAVFEVPLAFILDPANHRREARVIRGLERRFWSMPYGEHYIWGATAGMLVNLYEVLAH